MASPWNYSAGSGLPLDRVRFFCGDVNSGTPLLTDAEITDLLTLYPNTLLCAAEAADSIAARLRLNVDLTDDRMRVNLAQQALAFEKQAMNLRRRFARQAGGIPYAGGTSVSDKQAQEANTDRVGGAFWVDQDANHNTSSTEDTNRQI